MRRASFGLLVIGMLALGGSLVGQDKKDTPKEPVGKVKGSQLPSGWNAANLGLSDEQKNKIYAADAKYDGEIETLMKKINDLKAKKLEDQVAVLSKEQQKKLEDYFKSKAGTPK